MKSLNFPYICLPQEFVALLKSNLSVHSSASHVIDVIRSNRALYSVFETAFAEFDAQKGLEKAFLALGWPNFRERAASIYLAKSIYGHFPTNTNPQLVDEIKKFESRFTKSSVNSYSRLFLLGFYLKLANLQVQKVDTEDGVQSFEIPKIMDSYLQLAQGRSEKIDWLILILYHFHTSLGEKHLTQSLVTGRTFEEIFPLMTKTSQENMATNLLAYGASIHEPDVFLYEKV
jgi:hypothetical protein